MLPNVRVVELREGDIAVLQRCPLFEALEDAEMQEVLGCLNPRREEHEKNELVRRAGEPFSAVGLVLSGEVIITKETAAGNRMILEVLGPGGMFGEMAAFSGEPTWPATVIAQSPCTVLFLPPEKILGNCSKACANHKRLIANMMKIISRKALTLNKKIEYLTVRSIRGKLSLYLLEQYKKAGSLTLTLPLKRDELADFLNVSRPSLSRELCNMRDEGMIEFYRSSLKIKDLSSLLQAAES